MNLKTLVEQIVSEVLAEAQEPVRLSMPDMPVPEDIRKLGKIFSNAGHSLYLVGGAVRDALMGKTPKDYDVATGASPDEVVALLRRFPEYKLLEVGKAFGVVVVVTPEGEEYEIATFRKDIGKGRRPDAVEFTDISTDVLRRDLTINALFYDMSTGEVVDYVGGIEDIRNGVVKAVGDPRERFDEDRLRILRAVRFATRMGSALDPATEAAIKADNSLQGVSPERIRDEFLKSFKSAKSVRDLVNMVTDLNLWDDIFPGLSVNKVGIELDVPEVFLAWLLKDNDPSKVKKSLNKLKYSAKEVAQVWFLLNFVDLSESNAVDLWKINNKQVRMPMDKLELASKVFGSPSPKLVKAFTKYQPSVSSEELIQQGFKGRELGQKIKELETERFRSLL